MSSETFQKVGRGGAGNFWAPAGLEERGGRKQSEDLEAQRIPTSSSSSYSVPQASNEPSEYLRTGRGGAGNFLSTSDANIGPVAPGYVQGAQAEEVSASEKVGSGRSNGYSGRGGAGNWRQSDEEEKRLVESREAEYRSKVDERIKQDVEAGLTKPPKAYTGPDEKYIDQ